MRSDCTFRVYFAIYLWMHFICIRHKCGMRASTTKNTIHISLDLPEINIFRVICLVIFFKLTKWMYDNYVWCSMIVTGKRAYDHHHHHQHSESKASAGRIIRSLQCCVLAGFSFGMQCMHEQRASLTNYSLGFFFRSCCVHHTQTHSIINQV